VVFRGGEGALQVLPPLVDVIPEARLNLVIFYLKQDDIREAYNLIKDLEPSVPSEYNLKGVVNAAMGQETGSVRIGIDLCRGIASARLERSRLRQGQGDRGHEKVRDF